MSEDANEGNLEQVAGPWLGGVLPALLDFERLPGRYRLALREPGVLFEQPLVVMQLAAGRAVVGIPLAPESPEAQTAKQAARYFVRMAMLRAGSDHYTLLGLKTDFEPTTLRDHYRLMIRLTHPDFCTPGEEWPADAASRINMANDVLGSYVKRSGYDAQLAAEKASLGAVPASSSMAGATGAHPARPMSTQPLGKHRPPKGRSQPSEGWSPQTKMTWMACGAVACVVALLVLTPTEQGGSLVAQSARASADPETLSTSSLQSTGKGIVPAATAALATPSKWVDGYAKEKRIFPPKAVPSIGGDLRHAEEAAVLAVRAPSSPLRAAIETDPLGVAKGARASQMPSLHPEPPAPEQAAVITPPASPAAVPEAKPKLETAATTAPKSAQESGISPGAVVAVATVPTAAPAPAPPSMPEVQPKLSQIIGALDRGRGDLVMDAVDPAWNTRDARIAFLRGYYQFLQGQKISQLNTTSFRAHSRDTSLVVNGVFSIKMVDSFENTVTRDLHIKATFVRQKGQAVLTAVEASAPKS